MSLHLHPATASQGPTWLRRAFRLYFQRPLAFTMIFLAFLFAALMSLVLPLVGGLLVMMSLPLLSLGFMIATRSAVAGGAVTPLQLVEPLRRSGPARRQLLQLCVAYALGTLLIVALSEAVDGGRFEQLQRLMASDDATREEVAALLGDERLTWGLVVRFGLATLLAIPFWHAPALVWWGGQGTAQALFSSTLACWRTRGALLMYALSWGAVIIVFGLVTGGLFTLLGMRQLAGVAALPAGLMFTCVFYVSLYFTFSDTFVEVGETTGPQQLEPGEREG
jgi:hypothetical protein